MAYPRVFTGLGNEKMASFISNKFYQTLSALLLLGSVQIPVLAVQLDDVLSMDVVVHFIDVGVGDAILIETIN